jgi:hypothetical protein
LLNLNNYISFLLVFILPFSLRVVDDTIKFKEDKNQDQKFYNASSFHKLKYKRHNKIINEPSVIKSKLNSIKSDQVDFKSNFVADNINSKFFTGFIKPIYGRINSRFGKRNGGNHCGIDIQLNTGDTVYASNFGKVRYSKYHKGGYGNLIVLSHSNGVESYYAHLSKFLVSNESEVKIGQAIGLGGSTGRSTGPHLHFEIRKNGITVNPERFIYFGGRNLVKRDIEKIKAAPQITPVLDLIEAETIINKRKVILLGSSISKSTGFLANLKFDGETTLMAETPKVVSITINENFIKGTFVPSRIVSNQRLASLVSVAVAYKRPHSTKVEVVKGLLKVVN